jgi:hypothetical protein
VPNRAAPGASIQELIADFHTIFRVRIEDSGSTSELTVLDDGKVQYRLAPGCSKRSSAVRTRSQVASESWNWRETCPGSQLSEKLYEYALAPEDLSQLKGLLDREEVKQVRGCFCNAAPIFGDYAIEIPRSDSTQKLAVVAFMPQHIELREHPALTYLVCMARKIEQQVSLEATPAWCENLPRLK